MNNFPFVQESLLMERNSQIIALVYPDMKAVDREGIREGSLLEWLEKVMEENRMALNRQTPTYIHVSRIELHAEPFEKTPTQKIKRFLYQI